MAGVRPTWLFAALFAVCIGCTPCPGSAQKYFLGFNTCWAPSNAYNGDKASVDAVMLAGQKLGMKVMRSWAFNDKLPSAPGQYDEGEFEGLDYTVASAARHGLRTILSLGDYWRAYIGPEDYLTWATGSANGKTIVDFYSSYPTRQLYKQHIHTIVNRVNKFTGVAYKYDSTIMGWDVINEPRCPGCNSIQKAARQSWLAEMSAYLHSVAPKQLIFSGTEGFFQGDYAKYNPGAGSMCEGEDWQADNSIANIHVATAHVYERQVEEEKQLGWKTLDINQYLNYLVQKINVHTEIASKIGKPYIIEEYGITTDIWGDEERKMVFAVVYEMLIAAKRAGKPFIGAMFWGAAIGSQPASDGYNVYIDRTPSNRLTLNANVQAPGKGNEEGIVSDSADAVVAPPAGASRRLLLAQQLVAGADRQLAQEGTARRLHASKAAQSTDDFRMTAARTACATASSTGWWMSLPNNLVDVKHYRALVAGHDVVDIIAAAASVLNSS